MERLEAFEKMLADIKSQSEYETLQLEKLKAGEKKKRPPTGSILATAPFIA